MRSATATPHACRPRRTGRARRCWPPRRRRTRSRSPIWKPRARCAMRRSSRSASRWTATTSRSPTSRRTSACRPRSIPGSRCSASSSITVSISSTRAAAARCSFRCSRTIRSMCRAATTNFMVLTRATVSPGADGVMGTADDVTAGQHHDAVRRPEPDLHLACLASGVPAPVCARRRRRSASRPAS